MTALAMPLRPGLILPGRRPIILPWRAILRPLRLDGLFRPFQPIHLEGGQLGLVEGYGALAPLTFEWTASASNASTSAAVTFSNQAIGAATSDRIVIVLVAARGDGGSARQISSVTIGGTAGTLQIESGSLANPTGLAYRLVSSGTTATIVVNGTSTGFSNTTIGVCTIKGYRDSTPGTGQTSNGTGASRSLSLTVEAGGIGIWVVSVGQTAPSDITWTNATEQYDLSPGSALRGSGAVNTTGTGSISGQASWSGSLGNSMCAMPWR